MSVHNRAIRHMSANPHSAFTSVLASSSLQAACIPLALAGRDICGSAMTGSGNHNHLLLLHDTFPAL
jgi:hypothetical protein